MLRILIAENIPSLNKGEKAILDGMLESFKTLGDVQVSMLSARADIDIPRYAPKVNIVNLEEFRLVRAGLNNKFIKIFNSILLILHHIFFLAGYKVIGKSILRVAKANIWSEYLRSDLFTIGHNGAFAIRWGPIYFYPLFIPLFAKALGKPCVLYGGSVVLRKYFLRKVFGFVMNRIDLITLREDRSYENISKYKLKNEKVFVTGDPAFLLQPCSLKRVNQIMKQEGLDISPRPFVGMTVTREMANLAFRETGSFDNSYQKHTKMLAEFIDDLIADIGCTVIFVPHCIGYGEALDDRLVAQDIFRISHNKENIRLICSEYDDSDLKGIIGQFDMMIGQRLHSVVNAMSMNVPSIAMSYRSDQRLGIVEVLGQRNAICYIDNLDKESLLTMAKNTWLRRQEIKQELISQARSMKERSMFNGELLNQILDHKISIQNV